MNQPIEPRRIRDFGQIINDSFTFLKENFKPLFKSLIIICGFFIVIGTVSTAFTYMNMNTMVNLDLNSMDARQQPIAYLVSLFVMLFVLVLTQAFIHLTTLCYISVYLQKNNTTPTLEEVWGFFRYYFWRVLGSSILIFILVVVATMFCIIPGIYIGPIMYLVIPIIVIENGSFSFAFNKSFRLVKNNWWLLFGVIFIMSLIVGIGGSIAAIPLSIFTVSGKFLSLKGFTLPLIIVFSLLRNVLLLAYVLPAIAICMCYFSFAEQKDSTGLMDRIDKLGKTDEEQPPLPTEEY